jgi:hypothetical protein
MCLQSPLLRCSPDVPPNVPGTAYLFEEDIPASQPVARGGFEMRGDGTRTGLKREYMEFLGWQGFLGRPKTEFY